MVVVKRGVNDDELGEIIDFALQWKCVRGITFQPIQDAGRNEGFDPGRDRIVLSEIRRRIIEAGSAFGDGRHHPAALQSGESIAIGYALRKGEKIAPITSFFPRDMLVEALPNAITFEKYPELHKQIVEFLLARDGGMQQSGKARRAAVLPARGAGAGGHRATRTSSASPSWNSSTAYNFCLGRVKRSCIHFVTPDGQIVPFDTYNIFYRPGAAGNARLAAELRR